MWNVEIVSFWKTASIINILPNDSLVLSLSLHHTGAYPLSLHNLSSFLRISAFTSLPLRNWGLFWWLNGKESPANAGDVGSIPGSGIFLWRGKWQPAPVFLPGKSCEQRSPAGCSLRGRKRVEHDSVNSKETWFSTRNILVVTTEARGSTAI